MLQSHGADAAGRSFSAQSTEATEAIDRFAPAVSSSPPLLIPCLSSSTPRPAERIAPSTFHLRVFLA